MAVRARTLEAERDNRPADPNDGGGAWSEARYHACSALSELAFRNELNCMAIAQSEDGLEAIVEILDAEDVALKEDALLVVNNCAAFCVDVCTAIVSCPGMLDALKALVQVSAAGVSSVAVGAINCLSRCKEVREVLLHVGMLETLLPVEIGRASCRERV